MQALEEAQGSPDKLQSAPGVNLVREGLELFTAFKSFKNSCLEDEIGFAVDALHTKQTQCVRRVFSRKWPNDINSNWLISSHAQDQTCMLALRTQGSCQDTMLHTKPPNTNTRLA